MKMTLTIMSYRTVSVSIPDSLTVRREILLCSRWVNVPTLTQKTLLASILSITCNIQHVAQQQSPRKLQWWMLWRRTFRHSRQAGTVNRQSDQPNHVIMQMKARAGWMQRESEPLGHCAAWDPERSLRRKSDEKRTSQPMKRKRNGLRIMLREKPLGQESEFKMQRQRFNKSRTIWRRLILRDWHPENLKRRLRRCWLLSETVRVILQVPMMGRMGKTTMMKRLSRESWAMMTNPAGWWAQSPKQSSSPRRAFGRSKWNSTNWLNPGGRMQLTTSVHKMRSTAHPNWWFWQSFSHKRVMTLRHLCRQHLESLWGFLTLSPDYHNGRKGLLDQEVVISG